MGRLWSVLVLSSLTVIGAARAQPPQVHGSNVHYEFSWQDTGNNDGVLQPGEGAALSLTISFSPPSGSPITWNPSIGGSGSGDLRGIQSMFFDFVGGATAQGTWSGLWIHEGWDGGPPSVGTPAQGGARLNNIAMGQFPASQAAVNTTNPLIELWRGTWTPTSYAARTEMFQLQNASANPNPFPSFVIVRDPALPNLVLVGTSEHSASTVGIPIVPTPSAVVAGLAGLTLLCARRRSSPARSLGRSGDGN